MKTKNLFNISIILIPVIWFGCVGLPQNRTEMANNYDGKTVYKQTRSFGNEHYISTMKYFQDKGLIKIELKNNNKKVLGQTILGENEALLLLPKNNQKKFNFKKIKKNQFLPIPGKGDKVIQIKDDNDVLYTQKEYLRNLPNFNMKVMLIINSKKYLVQYEYYKPNAADYIPEMFIPWGGVAKGKFKKNHYTE